MGVVVHNFCVFLLVSGVHPGKMYFCDQKSRKTTRIRKKQVGVMGVVVHVFCVFIVISCSSPEEKRKMHLLCGCDINKRLTEREIQTLNLGEEE